MELKSQIDHRQLVCQAIHANAQEFPDREALILGNDRLTYRQLNRQINALAVALQRLGVARGDKVATILPTCTEAIYGLIAPAAIGAIAVPLNPMLRPPEVRHILADSGAAVLITVAEMFGQDYLQMIDAIRPALPSLRQIIILEGERSGTMPLTQLMKEGELAGRVLEDQGRPEDVSYLIYTSGTTGAPKGAMHSDANLLRLTNAVVAATGADSWRVLLNPFPLFHIGGIGLVLITLSIGGKVVLMSRFHPLHALQATEAERVTFFAGAPTMYQAMLSFPGSEKFDLSSLHMVAATAAPVPPQLLKALRDRIGCVVFNGYGSTEGGLISLTRPDDPEETQLATVGRPGPNVEIRVVDEHRQSLPHGQTGEIAIRAPFIMKGYYNRPRETAEVMDHEGWYYTGDMGALDAEGYLHILGRTRDMIIRGGENIYPAEIEDCLLSHPAVQIVAVIGVPDPLSGESVRAYVVLKEGMDVTPRELQAHCQGQIAAYKVPAEVRIVADLPMTATRKVQKFKLREEASQETRQAKGAQDVV